MNSVGLEKDHLSKSDSLSLLSGSILNQIEQYGLNSLDVANNESVLSAIPQALNRLEVISLRAMMDLFIKTGSLSLEIDGRSKEQIFESLKVASRHKWLVKRWLLALLDQEFIHNRDGLYFFTNLSDHSEKCSEEYTEDKTHLNDAYSALGFPEEMAIAHLKILNRLEDLITDTCTVSEILFEEGDLISALATYQQNWFTHFVNQAAGAFIRNLAQSKPKPMLKVLELGGGAGLMTSSILAALEGRPVNYRFTDISSLFTRFAQKQFINHIGLRTGLLDINLSFLKQSTNPASLDLVVAGNVLHNAQHIGHTLTHIRDVLTEDGWLVFTESTRDNYAMLTAMQFLLSPEEGQPMIGCKDRRGIQEEIFIDAHAWNQELEVAGFKLIHSLPSVNSPLSIAGQTLFIAKAV